MSTPLCPHCHRAMVPAVTVTRLQDGSRWVAVDWWCASCDYRERVRTQQEH